MAVFLGFSKFNSAWLFGYYKKDNRLKSKGKLGGQHKVPRLSNNRNYIDELLEMNALEAVAG